MTIALRPYLPADARRCAIIFRTSIAELAEEDYSEAQCAAWAALADDAAAFGASLSDMLTLLATRDGEIVGFASLKGVDHIEMIYVAPDHARQGVATALMEALEKIARARGATKLTADVSDTAKPLFDRRQFASQRRNIKQIDDEWLGNTTMSKALGPATSTH